MIPAPISPQITELQNQDARLVMADKALKREIEQLAAQASQPNAGDREALIAQVLANPENIATASDNGAKIKTAWQRRAAIDEARQSLKPKIAKARYEAATAALKGLKQEHDKLVQRNVSPLVQFAHAYVELFQLGRDLKDKDCGWREGVCDLLPALIELFGANNAYSPLASFLQAAVRAGYLQSKDLPKEFRA